MSTAELKNSLHKMVVETDDPDILKQVAALFASLLGEKDWWDLLSEEEKKKIQLGAVEAEKKEVTPYSKVKEKAKDMLSGQ